MSFADELPCTVQNKLATHLYESLGPPRKQGQVRPAAVSPVPAEWHPPHG